MNNPNKDIFELKNITIITAIKINFSNKIKYILPGLSSSGEIFASNIPINNPIKLMKIIME